MADTTSADTSSREQLSICKLILVPAIITLGITLIRLVGELQNWPSPLFGKAAGGGGSRRHPWRVPSAWQFWAP